MGALSVLPALDVRSPQQPNLLEQYGQLQALRGNQQQMQQRAALAPLQQQEAQQSVQQGGLDIEQKQRALQDQKASTAALSQWDGQKIDDLYPLMLKNGASASAVFGIKKQVLDQQTAIATAAKNNAQATEATVNATLKKHDAITGALSPLLDAKQVPDDQLPQTLDATIQSLVSQGLLDPQHAQAAEQLKQSGDPSLIRQGINQFSKTLMATSQITEQALKQAQTGLANANATNARGKIDPNSPLYAPSQDAVALGTAPGAKQIQTNEVQMAGRKAGAEAGARQPYELALAAQKQALSQGDPKAAGALLGNHDATLSELKSRGATPDFIAKALFYAKQANPTYSPQQDEAQFAVAKSPANTAFFGSAGSLTDKGGTLDQLAEAAKAIPQHDIPVFNTFDDAVKAAAGSGPIAHYASLLVGVADDYSKVMGGGAGSDTSRNQAIKLVPANASPDQRSGAIQGIRGAVASQMKSRIGTNPVMQRMYGSTDTAPQAAPVPANLKDTGQTTKMVDGVYDKGGKHYTVVSGKVYE